RLPLAVSANPAPRLLPGRGRHGARRRRFAGLRRVGGRAGVRPGVLDGVPRDPAGLHRHGVQRSGEPSPPAGRAGARDPRGGAPRVKLLYDIYHMQIMEGDVIRTVRDNKDWIAHFHTGGVPGRHELDDTQELNWRGVAAAIADAGFTGYVAHEFTPTRDPLASLREAVAVCTV